MPYIRLNMDDVRELINIKTGKYGALFWCLRKHSPQADASTIADVLFGATDGLIEADDDTLKALAADLEKEGVRVDSTSNNVVKRGPGDSDATYFQMAKDSETAHVREHTTRREVDETRNLQSCIDNTTKPRAQSVFAGPHGVYDPALMPQSPWGPAFVEEPDTAREAATAVAADRDAITRALAILAEIRTGTGSDIELNDDLISAVRWIKSSFEGAIAGRNYWKQKAENTASAVAISADRDAITRALAILGEMGSDVKGADLVTAARVVMTDYRGAIKGRDFWKREADEAHQALSDLREKLMALLDIKIEPGNGRKLTERELWKSGG